MRKILLLIAIVASCSGMPSAMFAQSSTVRLQVVNVPVDSGLLAELLPDFERSTGYRVRITKGEAVYDMARQGDADLVLSHYGHQQVDNFMADGLGLWPRAVFANQAALIGPASDPAGIRGIQDAVEAFRRIAQTKSRFIVNNAPTEKYLAQLLWESAGRPDQAGWYSDTGIRDQPAVQAADRAAAYILWGIIPFLKYKEAANPGLESFVVDDSILHRMMMTVIVNPERISDVNVTGAFALQKYLTSPEVQARIRAFRYPGVTHQLFWPAARDNIGTFLSDVTPLPGTADPAINRLLFDVTTVRPGDTFKATFTGANLSAETYFDVRFRRPGSTVEETALNWQQGGSATHPVPASSPVGVWRITAVRSHRDPDDHSAAFIPASASLTVQ